MSGFLLDTNVASETRKGQRINPGVLAWLVTRNVNDVAHTGFRLLNPFATS